MLSSDLMVATTLPSEYREDSMHAMSLLEEWLQRNAVIGHRGRIQALVRVVGALLDPSLPTSLRQCAVRGALT